MPTITITQTNIDDARRIDAARSYDNHDSLNVAKYCPVAQGCADAGFRDPLVSNGYVRLTDEAGARWRYDLPKAVQDFINAYDDAEHVEPLTFELENRIWVAGKTPASEPAATAGTLSIHYCAVNAMYRVAATFAGGREVDGILTLPAAERIAGSARRWWKRHQDEYLEQLARVEDPDDAMPHGWEPPRRRW
ncbi:MAG: hypothetical protein OXJ62_00410 [Spirochaetaceae bacterium]|nr:hypothetical protein [Spirochaetaceae bacterium]